MTDKEAARTGESPLTILSKVFEHDASAETDPKLKAQRLFEAEALSMLAKQDLAEATHCGGGLEQRHYLCIDPPGPFAPPEKWLAFLKETEGEATHPQMARERATVAGYLRAHLCRKN